MWSGGKVRGLEGPETYLSLLGVIPAFEEKLSTCRKYNIEAMIFIQAESQLKKHYKEDYETIIADCSTYIYLGSNELSTQEALSKRLGEQTIRVRDHSYSHGAKNSSSTSYKFTKRMLKTVDEIRRIGNDECFVLIQGIDPFYDKKYDTLHFEEFKKNSELGPYIFEYCNTKAEDIKTLEAKRRKTAAKIQENSSKTKSPSGHAVRMNPVHKGEIQKDPESMEKFQKHVESRTVSPQIDINKHLMSGGTIEEHSSDGKVVTINAKTPKVKQNFEMKGYTDKHNIQTFTSSSGTQSMLQDIDSVLV